VPGVSLLDAKLNCGQCGHSCGDDGKCSGGFCQARQEASVTGGNELVLVRELDGEVYYYEAEFFLWAIDGPAHTRKVGDWYDAWLTSGMSGDYYGGGIAGSGSDLYVHTQSFLYRVVDGGAPTQVGNKWPPIYNYDLRWFAQIGNRFAYTTHYELVVVDPLQGKVLLNAPSPQSRDLAASGGEFYWMEQPWNKRADGDPSAPAMTRIQRTSPEGVALTYAENARLTGLVAASDGLYYARVGPGGGIYRLPPNATGEKPELVASDDALAERTVVAVDDAHIYWLRAARAANGVLSTDHGEIVKRSKCGAPVVNVVAYVENALLDTSALIATRDRIYYDAQGIVWSVPK
jgi:hypothetical protein